MKFYPGQIVRWRGTDRVFLVKQIMGNEVITSIIKHPFRKVGDRFILVKNLDICEELEESEVNLIKAGLI
jgi:hypothetical protein